MYSYIIFTHIPVFYKINLYNEINKELKIHVVFIASDTAEKRSSDFTGIESINFSFDILSLKTFQNRNKLGNIVKITKILKSMHYEKIIVSGWDLIEFWYLIFLAPKNKNCLALESTILESKIDGIKGYLKKLFLSKVPCVFSSGKLQKELLDNLNYKGKIKVTNGVGIINKPSFNPYKRRYNKKYLYIGRLSEEKNLNFLITLFNEFPELNLSIIGIGPLINELKEIANKNIDFFGEIDNKRLSRFFFEHDFLILPSLKEPWGLVAEEALYFGMPVIISNRCGVSELIVDGENGFIFNSKSHLKKIIFSQNQYTYFQLTEGIKKNSINSKDIKQVKTYVKN